MRRRNGWWNAAVEGRLQFCRRVTVFDVLIEVDAMRSSLHEGIKDFLRNTMVLVNSAVIELDL